MIALKVIGACIVGLAIMVAVYWMCDAFSDWIGAGLDEIEEDEKS